MMLNRILIVVFTIAALMGQAQAAMRFQYRSTQLDAFHTYALNDWYRVSANGQVPALVADSSTAGVFGQSKLDIRGLIGPNAIGWPFLNVVSNTGAITILIRLIPTFTGNPSSLQTLANAIGSDGQSQGFYLRWNTDGTINLNVRDRNQSDRVNVNSDAYSSAVSGQPMDIGVSWDGTNNAGSVKFYAAQNGNAMTNFSSKNPAAAFVARDPQAVNALNIGIGVFGSFSAYLNEFVYWDSVEDLAALGARTDFVSASAFEGLSYSDPGASNVKTGTAYTYAGTSQTGTYTGSDRWTDPGVANVRSGTAYKADSTTNNRTGTAAIPAASNVLSGVSVDATTGTYTAPASAAEVKIGVAFGAGGALTGTYDGSDRWTCPLAGQLTTGVQLKCNSTSLNLTGTRDTVTNILSTKTMSGSSTSGTLIAR